MESEMQRQAEVQEERNLKNVTKSEVGRMKTDMVADFERLFQDKMHNFDPARQVPRLIRLFSHVAVKFRNGLIMYRLM